MSPGRERLIYGLLHFGRGGNAIAGGAWLGVYDSCGIARIAKLCAPIQMTVMDRAHKAELAAKRLRHVALWLYHCYLGRSTKLSNSSNPTDAVHSKPSPSGDSVSPSAKV